MSLDLALSIGKLSHFCEALSQEHSIVVMPITKYVNGTLQVLVRFLCSESLFLHGFIDSD